MARLAERLGAWLGQYTARLTSGTQGQVLRLALPAVGEQVLNMTVGLANTYMVGHHGSTALTAVGLSDNVVMLVSSFFTAVATGSTALVARAMQWFRDQGCEYVEVGTDQNNIAAIRTYEGAGFRTIYCSLTLSQRLR